MGLGVIGFKVQVLTSALMFSAAVGANVVVEPPEPEMTPDHKLKV